MIHFGPQKPRKSTPLGRAIRAARLRMGLTQKQLAEAAGVWKTKVCDIERGAIRFPAEETLRKLEKALKLEEGTLLKIREEFVRRVMEGKA